MTFKVVIIPEIKFSLLSKLSNDIFVITHYIRKCNSEQVRIFISWYLLFNVFFSFKSVVLKIKNNRICALGINCCHSRLLTLFQKINDSSACLQQGLQRSIPSKKNRHRITFYFFRKGENR